MKLSYLAAAALFISLGAAAESEGGGALSARDVKAKFEAAGYTDVTGIRNAQHGHFEAMAKKDGKPVKLDYDRKSGAVTPESSGS